MLIEIAKSRAFPTWQCLNSLARFVTSDFPIKKKGPTRKKNNVTVRLTSTL